MLDKKNKIVLFVFMLSLSILAVSLVAVVNGGQTLYFVLGALFCGLTSYLSRKFTKFLIKQQVKQEQHEILEKVVDEQNLEEKLVNVDEESEEPRE